MTKKKAKSVATGKFVCLEEDRDEFGRFVLEGVPSVGTGQFLCLEPDREEYTRMVLEGKYVEIPPPPPPLTEGGGFVPIHKPVIVPKRRFEEHKEFKILCARLGIRDKEFAIIEASLGKTYEESKKIFCDVLTLDEQINRLDYLLHLWELRKLNAMREREPKVLEATEKTIELMKKRIKEKKKAKRGGFLS